MKLEYTGRVPGGTAGRVGVERGGISPCVHRAVLARVGGR